MTSCNIDREHPAGLVPTQEPVSVDYRFGDKLWCVQHTPSGRLLHIRINDDAGKPLTTTPEVLDWWIGHSEEQAVAQASFLGDDWRAAFFVCTGEPNDQKPNP